MQKYKTATGELTASKEKGKRLMKSLSSEIWGKRPLSEALLKYAAVDVLSLFALFDKLNKNIDMSRLHSACQRYITYKRDITTRKYNKYENNGFLPYGIFNTGQEIICSGCRRVLPRNAFSNTQKKKENDQKKCKVCTKFQWLLLKWGLCSDIVVTTCFCYLVLLQYILDYFGIQIFLGKTYCLLLLVSRNDLWIHTHLPICTLFFSEKICTSAFSGFLYEA